MSRVAASFLNELRVGMTFKARHGYDHMPYSKNVLTLERIGEQGYGNPDDRWLYLRTETGQEVDCRAGWLRRFWYIDYSKPAQVSSDGQ